MNYPLTLSLICKLKEEYDFNAYSKGDSWFDCSISFLFKKSKEEFNEILNAKTSEETQEEILDLILILSMLYEKLNCLFGTNYKMELLK
jgi:hypothetical protein